MTEIVRIPFLLSYLLLLSYSKFVVLINALLFFCAFLRCAVFDLASSSFFSGLRSSPLDTLHTCQSGVLNLTVLIFQVGWLASHCKKHHFTSSFSSPYIAYLFSPHLLFFSSILTNTTYHTFTPTTSFLSDVSIPMPVMRPPV